MIFWHFHRVRVDGFEGIYWNTNGLQNGRLNPFPKTGLVLWLETLSFRKWSPQKNDLKGLQNLMFLTKLLEIREMTSKNRIVAPRNLKLVGQFIPAMFFRPVSFLSRGQVVFGFLPNQLVNWNSRWAPDLIKRCFGLLNVFVASI